MSDGKRRAIQWSGCVGLGLAMLGLVVWNQFEEMQLVKHGVATQATVISTSRKTDSLNPKSHTYHLYVKFQDVSGKAIKKEMKVDNHYWVKVQKGDTIDIVYDKTRPSLLRLGSELPNPWSGFNLLIYGISVLLIVIGVFLKFFKTSSA